MFGYVFPLKGELKLREYEVFKGYYCGLCRTLGKKSVFSKFVLNYDMTFLAILLSSLFTENEEASEIFCPYKMRKVMVMPENNYIGYAADMNIILSSKKLLDNYNDDGNIISLAGSRILKIKNITKAAADKINTIDRCLKEINILEGEKCSNIDEIGHSFAQMTGEIFSLGDEKNKEILRVLGYNIGKWIYTIDAYDDLVEDIKRDRYNPCIYTFGFNSEDPSVFKDRIKDSICFTLMQCLNESSKAFELLDIRKNKGLLENIIYLGLIEKTNLIIDGGLVNEKSVRCFRGKARSFNG